MSGLFRSFNPNTVIFFFTLPGNWISIFSAFLVFPQIYWILKSKSIKTVEFIICYILKELYAALGSVSKPGIALIFMTFFFTIIIGNFLGLFPYIFTASRHLSFTLSLGLPVWLGYMLFSFTRQFNHNIAHLVPEGTPAALIPLMVVIERISLIIRPFTLAIRLSANMIAGHLLLTLLGSQGPSAGVSGGALLILSLCLLLTLECAVACIQAYVFTILSTLYLEEHNSVTISKVG